MTFLIGDLERDAITELLNIAIGQAAAGLSQLVEDEVRLSVPFVDFLTPDQAARRLDIETKGGDAVAVRQHFNGPFAGDILLLFPERRSLDLVRHMLGDEVPLSQLTELEQEALQEVGNIILNGCLGSLANQLNMRVESSLPTYLRGPGSRILAGGGVGGARDAATDSQGLAMFLHVDFALLNKDIDGYLAFIMDIASAERFVDAVRAYLDGRI
ncbi:Chemotaxis protein, CheC family [Magnetospirillum sp. LM-5]|uniref:chemotaxis protein CheC n=1 Tax=Magnetospirillum sp. LM-5 TaxID=2681466 RepID=UPI00137DE96C|nr:chemotaxis protein CheC [Magnetospirillum sp. LM-5]CAA7624947.1 Chemotaxis protein, CheC family [Magnetospirillum sp. LM-5]